MKHSLYHTTYKGINKITGTHETCNNWPPWFTMILHYKTPDWPAWWGMTGIHWPLQCCPCLGVDILDNIGSWRVSLECSTQSSSSCSQSRFYMDNSKFLSVKKSKQFKEIIRLSIMGILFKQCMIHSGVLKISSRRS